MNNSEIEQAEKDLSEIEKMTDEAQQNERLKIWIKKYGVYVSIPTTSHIIWNQEAFSRAHTFLQTKMMLNACTTARSSCKWAAIAATVAALGVLAGWYTYLFKTIMLMFSCFILFYILLMTLRGAGFSVSLLLCQQIVRFFGHFDKRAGRMEAQNH